MTIQLCAARNQGGMGVGATEHVVGQGAPPKAGGKGSTGWRQPEGTAGSLGSLGAFPSSDSAVLRAHTLWLKQHAKSGGLFDEPI